MKNLLIIGARGYGRGAYDIARSMSSYGNDFIVKGYLDDNSNALDGYDNYPPIISSVEEYSIQENDIFVCALGNVEYKEKYVNMIKKKGGVFFSIIHSGVSIGNNTKIGEGCIIGYNTQVDCDVKIGNFVNLQTNVVVGHDSIIDDWTIMDCFSFTGGYAKIGKRCSIHTGSIIIPRITIGDNCTINAGSVVIRNLCENRTVMGNPAKELIFPKFPKNK